MALYRPRPFRDVESGNGKPLLQVVAAKRDDHEVYRRMAHETGRERIRAAAMGQRYRDIAEREGVAFLDAGQVIRCSDLDGIHYEVDQHELLGRAVAEAVQGALAPPVVSIE